jgi:hypothetical protein
MERSGPIAAAVRSAGYASESEELSEEGSSIEEEEEEVYNEAREEIPPSYVHKEPAGYPVSLIKHFRYLSDIVHRSRRNMPTTCPVILTMRGKSLRTSMTSRRLASVNRKRHLKVVPRLRDIHCHME